MWLAASPQLRVASWSVLVGVDTAGGGDEISTAPGVRLRVYLPNGADQGPLPTPASVAVAYPLNDVGGLTFSYALRGPRSNLLGQPCEIAVEVSVDGGQTWSEPVNSRFVYISDGRDPIRSCRQLQHRLQILCVAALQSRHLAERSVER